MGDNFEIHAPELIVPEFGNILWKKYKLGELSAGESLYLADEMLKEDITFHEQAPLLRESLRKANATGQTVYDWSYLILALSIDAKFVTADRRFFLAVRKTSHKSSVVWVENIPALF